MKGAELPEEINRNREVKDLLEKIRGTAACMMGFAGNIKEAAENSPAVPEVGFFTTPRDFTAWSLR